MSFFRQDVKIRSKRSKEEHIWTPPPAELFTADKGDNGLCQCWDRVGEYSCVLQGFQEILMLVRNANTFCWGLAIPLYRCTPRRQTGQTVLSTSINIHKCCDTGLLWKRGKKLRAFYFNWWPCTFPSQTTKTAESNSHKNFCLSAACN